MRIVLDTCVLYSALRSKTGASYRVLAAVLSRRVEICLSLPVWLEYNDVLGRLPFDGWASAPVRRLVLAELAAVAAEAAQPKRSLRPLLRDPDDERILEAAVYGGADAIVTMNIRDFVGADAFHMTVMTPADLLRQL